MECALSAEYIRQSPRAWIIVETDEKNRRVIDCIEVSARRADALAACVKAASRVSVRVSVESTPRYTRKR